MNGDSTPETLIGTGSETLFARGGGLVGAYYAARGAAKPKIDVHVEG